MGLLHVARDSSEGKGLEATPPKARIRELPSGVRDRDVEPEPKDIRLGAPSSALEQGCP